MKIEQNVGVAIYTKKGYEKLLTLSDNRADMNDTWLEWRKKTREMKQGMKALGVIVKDVKVDIDEIVRYCRQKGIPNDGAARAQFVQQKLIGEI